MNFRSKISLFTAFFFDFFSFSLMIPLLPMLIFEYCPETKYLTLGFLLACYPLAQMIGAPWLGKLSDRTNKKQILLIAYLGNLIGYLLSALALYTGYIGFLFLGHLVAGGLGANMSMTYALLSEESCQKKKFQSFSLTSLLLATTFILSPLISKQLYLHLGSIQQVGMFTLAIASLATLLNILLIQSIFIPPPLSKEEIIEPCEKPLLISTFFFFFAWYGFIKFFQAYALDHLALTYDSFCNLLSLMGISSAITQLFNSLYHAYYTPTHRMLKGTTYLLGLSFCSLLLVKSYAMIVIITLIIAISHAIISPYLLYAFANLSSARKGQNMGGYQAIQSLAKTLAPPILGIGMTVSLQLPLILCSLCLFLSPAIPRLQMRSNRRNAAASSSTKTV
ncbi:MAG: MFS transporter [Simkaniaceae bacterium]|nr:MFS transporter [Simkaniaceae bacterium]